MLEKKILMCDLVLPCVNGYDVVKTFNELGKPIKIGIITGWDDGHDSPDDEDCKIDFYLKKPFNRVGLENHKRLEILVLILLLWFTIPSYLL